MLVGTPAKNTFGHIAEVTHSVHLNVVLSTLYQEKMLTEQEMEELKPLVRPWDHLVHNQCTKPLDVVKRTAELLAEVGCDEEGKRLKGQWGCGVSFFSSLFSDYWLFHVPLCTPYMSSW